jgi:hypothetical protein
VTYTRKQRSAAAVRGWQKRRATVDNQLPNYPLTPGTPSVPSSETEDIAYELPTTLNSLAAGIAKWDDPLKTLDTDSYLKLFNCPAIIKSIRKLTIRTSKLDWTIVDPQAKEVAPQEPATMTPEAMPEKPGMALAVLPQFDAPPPPPEPKTSKRAQQITEIFSRILGWSDFIENCTWALPEGMRIHQIKTAVVGKWKVPDFTMGGRRKYNAGGDIEWDGTKLVQVMKATGQEVRDAKILPIEQFAIHRPGPGSNPEGDLNLGVALFNAVARPHNRAIAAGDDFIRLAGVPYRIMSAKLDKVTASTKSRVLGEMKTQAQGMVSGAAGAMSDDNVVKLLQADPRGLTGIVEWLRYLESVADDIITLAVLTGGSGTSNANRTGDTMVQRDNEDEGAFFNAMQIAATFNRYVLPWIVRNNEDELEPLADGEAEVYLWPGDPDAGNTQSAKAEAEGPAKQPGKGTAPSDNRADGDKAPPKSVSNRSRQETVAAIKEMLRSRRCCDA